MPSHVTAAAILLGCSCALLACGDAFTLSPNAGGAGGAMATGMGGTTTGGGQSGQVAGGGGMGGGGNLTCSASSTFQFKENFEADELAPQRWLWSDLAHLGVNGGVGYIDLEGVQGEVWLATAVPRSIVGCQVLIETRKIPDVQGASNVWFGLVNSNNYDQRISVVLSGAATVFESRNGATVLKTSDVELERWWRLHDEQGKIHFSTSDDGTQWTHRGEVSTPLWATNVFVELGAQGPLVEGEKRFHFDNYNLPP